MSKDVLLHTLWIAALVVFPLTVQAQVDVYWLDDGVQRADLDGTNRRTVIPRMGAYPIAIAFDTTVGHVYWSEVDDQQGRIRRADADREVFETVVEVDGVVSMAVDGLRKKLYWVSLESSPSIQRSNLDGTAIETLVTDQLVSPLSIALHVRSGKIYWSDMNRQTITRANLDGSNIEEIVADSGLIGMTIDPVNDYLYWSADISRIKRSKLDGSDVETIIEGSELSSPDFEGSGLPQPMRLAVDPATGDIYWMSTGQFSAGNNVGAIVKSNAIASEIRVVADYFWPRTHGSSYAPPPNGIPFDIQIVPGTDQIAFTMGCLCTAAGDPQPNQYLLVGAGVPNNSPALFKINGTERAVYWRDADRSSQPQPRIYRSSTDGDGKEFMFGVSATYGAGLKDFVYHRESKTFYLSTDPYNNYLHYSAPYSASIVSGDGSSILALDTVNSKVYWINRTAVGRENFDRTEVETLVDLTACDGHWYQTCGQDLSLDLAGGRMYWRRRSQIKSATLDGNDTTTVLTDPASLSGFSADWVERKLYWLSEGMLRRSNVDGSSIETLWEVGEGAGNLVVVNASPQLEGVALTSPTDAATGLNATVALEWSAAADPVLYKVQVSESSTFEKILFSEDTSTLSSTFTAHYAGRPYYWRVWSFTPTSLGRSETWSFSIGKGSLVATNLSPSEGSTGVPVSPLLTWSHPEGSTVSHYRVQVGTNKTLETLFVDEDSIDGTKLQLTGLQPETSYYWRVAGVNEVGWFTFTEPARFRTILAAPGGITQIIGPDGDGGGNTLDEPGGIATDGSGNVFVTGSESDNAFKITPRGTITEIIGREGDGVGNTLDRAHGIATDGSGNVFVAGGYSDNAFKITPGGTIIEIIGPEGDGVGNTLDHAHGIATDASGNVFVTGRYSSNAFKITPSGEITQIIGSNGDRAGNTLSYVDGIATDGSGNVFVTGLDGGNAFKITPSGAITQIIGPDGDGAGNTLEWAKGIATDGFGNVFVAGIRSGNTFKITPEGTITQIIDQSGGVATDDWGNVFVGGVFKITPEGTITKIMGQEGDGAGNALGDPFEIATDAWGNVFVTGGWSDNAFKFTAELQAVGLTNPADGSTGESAFTRFVWQEVAGASLYHLQVDPDNQFTSAAIDDSSLTATSYTPQSPLAYGSTYHWRVRAGEPGGAGATKTAVFGPWSEVRSFTVAVGTATEDERTGIPTSYALHGNYPNPFNPTTTIQIDLPETAHVTLAVYNVLGHEVLRLESGTVSVGRHRYTVDASTLPSGVYLYRLETPEFSQSRRMMLLK